MPVKVKCGNCDKILVAPDAARGKAIKCPECQTRISVPAADSTSKSAGDSSSSDSKRTSAKPKPKKPSRPVDSEDALATFDMRRAEDTEARICPKCGHDMQYQDEEDTECPKCGYDSEEGGLGLRARKKAMKGPDPADFYPNLVSQSWKFVGKNQVLAWRSVLYTFVCLTIAISCGWIYLRIPMWPPRAFFALCFTISALVIPGWMWFLDVEVIRLTLEKKDKFKKLNFDFFLASAMGVAFIFWCITVAIPVMALPGALGYVMVNYGGMPEYVLYIFIGIGAIPAVWMLPVVMSHMAMPIQYKGWMVWKVIPLWAKNIPALSIWLLWFLITNIPNIAGLAVIGAVYGQDLVTMVTTMEDNAAIERKRIEAIDNPNLRRVGQGAPEQVVLPDPQPVSYFPLIVPCIILAIMCVANGFTSMFNMRTNGLFTYYNKASLDMIERAKEYKYRARERRDTENDDEVIKTTSQEIVDAIVFFLVFDLFGVVAGMLIGSFSTMGIPAWILLGVFFTHSLAVVALYIQSIIYAFHDGPMWGLITIFGLYPIGFSVYIFQDWETRKAFFFKIVLAMIVLTPVLIATLMMGLLLILFGYSQPGS